MGKSLKARIWLLYKLDIPVCLKQKIFLILSYHVLTTYVRIFGFKNLCVAQVYCKFPIKPVHTHLQKSKNSEITC